MPNSNHLAPTRETVEERARNAVRDLQELVPHPGADRTYRSEWKRYVGWVQQKRNERVVPEGNRFITREVVDLYFAQVVALRVVKPATARRAISTLQWQADKDEYLGERVRFVVDDSQCVKDALRAQERLYNQHLENSIEDPHDKLPTDTLSRQDLRRIISTALAEKPSQLAAPVHLLDGKRGHDASECVDAEIHLAGLANNSRHPHPPRRQAIRPTNAGSGVPSRNEAQGATEKEAGCG